MTKIANVGQTVEPVDSMHPHPRNPNQGDVGSISESIEAHGFYGQVIAQQSSRTILAGEHRWRAAKAAGMGEIPVTWVDVDDDQALRIVLVDNRSAELAYRDPQGLVDLLQELAQTPLALTGTGYDGDALDELLADLGPPKVQGADVVSEPPEKPVTKPGDLWELGPHRLLCGDCRNPNDVVKLLDGAVVNLAFTSPPYADRRKYDETSGFKPIPPDQYVEWFAPVAANVAKHLADDGSWFVNIRAGADDGERDLYVYDLVIAHRREWGWRFVDDLCWVRGGVPGKWPNRFKNGWEPVFHFSRSETIRFRPDAMLHESDRVWSHDPVHAGTAGSGSGLPSGHEAIVGPGMALPSNVLAIATGGFVTSGLHSAEFPVGLPAWFTKAYTDPGNTIYDPFMGSGSTLIAAEQEHRVGYGTEISPGYCDVIAKRYQGVAGIVPTRDGKPHDFLAGASK